MGQTSILTDRHYMQRCLELATLGLRLAAPNPSVGCVIVLNDRIIGEGCTQPYGGKHGEVVAIESVNDQTLLRQATLYVSLEPCSHFGKTPPCTDLIIAKRIKNVVIACIDPFAHVNGEGIQRLIKAGVNVRLGILEDEAQLLNRRFFTFHQKKRPYVILKWAESADGLVDRIRTTADQPPAKITGEVADVLVHKWRSEETAILVGKNTALLDDPSLTVRKYAGPNPYRVLLDPELEVPPTANIFSSDAPTIVFSNRTERTSGPTSVRVSDVHDVRQVLHQLYERNILSVLVEGGPTIHRAFYQAGLWDEIRRFRSKQQLGDGIPALQLSTETPESETTVGNDTLTIYRK